MRPSPRVVIAAALAVALLAAPRAAWAQSASPAPAAPAAQVSDAQIAGIVVAANAIDVEAGRVALAKSQTPEVRRFAELMITDHTAVNEAAAALVQRLGVTPAESQVRADLESSAARTRAELEALGGDAFDRAYLDHEITYHQAVIDALDGLLIPSARNAELRAALTGARPAFQAHLDHARQARQALDR